MKILTLNEAQQLIGKTIRTVYFGYKGQDGEDMFTVGKILSQYDIAASEPMEGYSSRAAYWDSYMNEYQLKQKHTNYNIMTSEGRNTFIVCHTEIYNYFETPTFTCSDADREVYFEVIEIKKIEKVKTFNQLAKQNSPNYVMFTNNNAFERKTGYVVYEVIDNIIRYAKWFSTKKQAKLA